MLSTLFTWNITSNLILSFPVLIEIVLSQRDLKPENILLDEKMHIVITDFGSAKILKDDDERNEEERGLDEERRKNSFVGTAQYVSPELLTDKTASHASDLWALGCIIYQMISGLPPFRSRFVKRNYLRMWGDKLGSSFNLPFYFFVGVNMLFSKKSRSWTTNSLMDSAPKRRISYRNYW